jgi:hypothetical protein
MNAGDAEVRGTTIEAIQQAVADMFGLPAEQLRQKSPRGVATGSFVDRRSWYLTDFGDRERRPFPRWVKWCGASMATTRANRPMAKKQHQETVCTAARVKINNS